MKKLLKTLLLTAICLIPTVMAVLFYMNENQSPIETSDLTALEWKGPSGTARRFVMSEDEDAEFISFLLDLNQNAEEIDKLPKDADTEKVYTATFLTNGVRSVYRYYFSTVSPSNSYLVASDKKVYRIDAVDTITFLDSKHSSDLYPASILPTMTVAGNPMDASSASWTYYTYSGTGHTLTKDNTDIPTFTASYVGISISTSMVPDIGRLEITDDSGNVLYKGNLADFDSASSLKKLIRKDTLLHFSIDAKWEDRDGARYTGNAQFRFDVQTVFDPTAHFWLGESTVELGDMVVLSGEFVDEISDLSFTSSPTIGFNPTFVRDGELVRALIPISQLLASGAGNYTLTVICQGKEYPLTLTVTQPSYADTVRNYNHSQKVNTSLRTESNLEKFKALIASTPVTSSLLWKDKFELYSEYSIRAAFGQTVHNTKKDADDFISNGAAFVAYHSTPIRAVNQGIVVTVTDTAYGGHTVIVDHGWGLFSVYYGLGSIEIEQGSYVTAETIIGYGGREGKGVGYTDGITSYCELWVGGQPISYYPLENEGIVLGSPE